MTEIYVPEEISGIPVTGIGEYAFFGCNDLVSIQIPVGVTNIAETAFMTCDKLEVIYAQEGSYAAEWAQNAGYQVNAEEIVEDGEND